MTLGLFRETYITGFFFCLFVVITDLRHHHCTCSILPTVHQLAVFYNLFFLQDEWTKNTSTWSISHTHAKKQKHTPKDTHIPALKLYYYVLHEHRHTNKKKTIKIKSNETLNKTWPGSLK